MSDINYGPVIYVVERPVASAIERLDLSWAEEYGVLKYVAHPNDVPRLFDPVAVNGVVWAMRHKLRHFKPGDFLLMNGPPPLTAIAVTIVAAERMVKVIQMLYFDVNTGKGKLCVVDLETQPHWGAGWPVAK